MAEWVSENKKKIKYIMGGVCVVCGYNKCANALHVHHINPKLKTINFANILSYKKSAPSVETLISEMRNCCLLCANCHAEAHYEGLNNANLKSSFDLQRFNEFSSICNICGCVNDNPFYKHCRCRLKISNIKDVENSKVDWEKVDVVLLLYVYDGNFSAVGKNLGISDNAVKKQFYKVTGYKDFLLYSEELPIITITDKLVNLNFVDTASNFLNSQTRYENLKTDLLEILQNNEFDIDVVLDILGIEFEAFRKRLYCVYGTSSVEKLKNTLRK